MQALAQDQLRALRHMCAAAFGDDAPHVEVYDGDTIRVLHTCITATRSACAAHVHSNPQKSACCAKKLNSVDVAVFVMVIYIK